MSPTIVKRKGAISLLHALVGVIKMEKTVRDFVWTEGPTKSAAHLVKWDTTSLLICYGDRGIGSLRQKNNVLTKWLWTLCKEDNVLSRRIIVAIYGLEKNVWPTKLLNRERSYRLWAGIL